MTELVRYEAARRALAEAVAVDEVMQVHDRAKALQYAAKIAGDKTLEIQSAQLRFRAERRFGEMMAEQHAAGKVARGGRPKAEKTPDEMEGVSEQDDPAPITLRDLGVDYRFSSKAQKIAAMDAAEFERALEKHAEEMRSGRGRVAMDLLKVDAEEKGREHRRSLAQTLSDASAQLQPSGRRYPVIYADPAWRRHQGVTDRSYENHYPTMTWDEICALPIADMVLPDAWLFLWIPRAHAFALHEIETEVEVVDTGEIVRARVAIPLGYAVAKAWGFDSYSTLAVWTKTDEEHPSASGTGKIFRDQDELLLLFKRGQGLPMPEKKFGSNHRERPREHSRKPDFYREMIASMAGGLPVLELFARVDAEHPLPEGWGAWGNQSQVSPEVATEKGGGFPVAAAPSNAEETGALGVSDNTTGGAPSADGAPPANSCLAAAAPSDAGEAAMAAAAATDRASAAAAVAEPPYNAGDVIVIDQLAGSDWLAPAELDALELEEIEQLRILSDFCHPKRDAMQSVLGPIWEKREMAYLSGGQWQLREAGKARLRELIDATAPPARVDMTEPYRAPQMSLFDAAMPIADAPPAEIVDGALQTRLPIDDDELSEQLALLDIAAGRWSAVDSDMVRHLVGARGFAHCTTDRVLVTDEGRAFLAQLVAPASVQQQGLSHG